MRVPVAVKPRTRRSSEGQSFIRNGGSAGPASGARLAQQMGQAANTLGSVGGLLTQQATQAKMFGQLQAFSAFQTSVDETLTELKRNADPAQGNFADQATAVYNNMETEWLANVPDEFHDEFKTRATDVKARVARDALAFQYERTDEYFRQGTTDALNQALIALDQDGSVANLEAQRAFVDEYLETTTLTDAEKVATRRKVYTALESVSYKAEVRRGNLEVGALGVGSAPGQAVDLLLEFDGTTLENGLPYETNRELLDGRVREAEQIAVKATGDLDRWVAMPERARAALISVADDLGEIPESVQRAIDSGNLEEVALAVAELGGERREVEAQIIMGMAEMPEGQLDTDPRYANIPYEDRLALRADAEREAAAQQAQATAEQIAAQKTAVNDLMVGILDGKAGQFDIDQLRETGTLTDYADIKRAQDALAKRDGDISMVQTMQEMLAAGLTINPADEDHRNMFNTYIGNQGLAAMQNMDGDFVQNVLIPSVRTAGDLPTDTVGTLSAMMRSQDPRRALFALDTLSQLEQASPEAYNARVSAEVAADVLYWQSIKDYYPQQEVLDSVRGGTTQEQRTRNTMMREEARKMMSDGTVKTPNLANAIGQPGWFQGDPILGLGASQALNADYAQIFEKEYARDGNAAAAEKRSIAALGRVWKTTSVGGQSQLMRYPPEATGYETWNGSHEWIGAQVRTELELPEGTPFQLISDDQTESEFLAWQTEGGPRPSYMVTYRDENGDLTTPMMYGQPRRMFFQVTPEMEAQKRDQLGMQTQAEDNEQFMVTYNRALQHSLATGFPVPEELQAEFKERTSAIPGR